jgi:hypothetical protein
MRWEGLLLDKPFHPDSVISSRATHRWLELRWIFTCQSPGESGLHPHQLHWAQHLLTITRSFSKLSPQGILELSASEYSDGMLFWWCHGKWQRHKTSLELNTWQISDDRMGPEISRDFRVNFTCTSRMSGPSESLMTMIFKSCFLYMNLVWFWLTSYTLGLGGVCLWRRKHHFHEMKRI